MPLRRANGRVCDRRHVTTLLTGVDGGGDPSVVALLSELAYVYLLNRAAGDAPNSSLALSSLFAEELRQTSFLYWLTDSNISGLVKLGLAAHMLLWRADHCRVFHGAAILGLPIRDACSLIEQRGQLLKFGLRHRLGTPYERIRLILPFAGGEQRGAARVRSPPRRVDSGRLAHHALCVFTQTLLRRRLATGHLQPAGCCFSSMHLVLGFVVAMF